MLENEALLYVIVTGHISVDCCILFQINLKKGIKNNLNPLKKVENSKLRKDHKFTKSKRNKKY